MVVELPWEGKVWPDPVPESRVGYTPIQVPTWACHSSALCPSRGGSPPWGAVQIECVCMCICVFGTKLITVPWVVTHVTHT